MNITDPDNNQYLQLAISTVFYLNRDRIHLHMDDSGKEGFITDISSEIMARAKRFKLLTNIVEELK